MSGAANYPTSLDDNVSLFDVTDGSSVVAAAHHNNMKEAIKALEAKLGVRSSAAPTSVDYRLGNPTGGHNHDGLASGNGGPIPASAIAGFASLLPVNRFRLQSQADGNFSGSWVNNIPGVYLDRTVQLESVMLMADQGPSGGSQAWDVNLGATSVWYASQGNRLIMLPTTGFALATMGAPNTVTIPSGSMLHVDTDNTVTFGPVNPSIVFVFRE